MNIRTILVLIFTIPSIYCYADNSNDTTMTPPSLLHDDQTGMGSNMGMDTPMVRQPTPEDDLLTWDVPKNWKEVPASGLRLASFKPSDNSDDIDVSIVLLGGMPGTVLSNLERWAGQIEVEVPSQDLAKFAEKAKIIKTKIGTDAKIFDFTKLQKSDQASTMSMITAMIELEHVTVFVKMMGTIESVKKNFDAFKALTQSIHRK